MKNLSSPERQKIQHQISKLLEARDVYLAYGYAGDANRCTEAIGKLQKKFEEGEHERSN
jgi:hypothetical protein